MWFTRLWFTIEFVLVASGSSTKTREFVRVGIEPDIPVHVTRADIVAGRDPVLETAVLWLQAKP